MKTFRGKRARPWLIALALAATVALSLTFASAAWARAGGGEHFPGLGGGGGGDGGDNGIVTLLIWLVIYSPLPWPIKIIVLIALIVGGARFTRRRRARLGGGYAPAKSFDPGGYIPPASSAPSFSPDAAAAGLEALRQRDPNFSQQHFEDTVSTAFIKIQESWSRKNMDIARAFVTPSLLARFHAQIEELKRMGRQNHVDQATIGSVDIVEVDHDGGMDYITARLVAAAADYTTDGEGRIVAGSKSVRQFTEYWTFMRSDQVTTQAGKEEVASQHCPNCGAPLQITAVGKCEYCSSDITSGQFSWVLSEITQASAFRPRAQSRRPAQISPLAGERYVLGLVQCPNCGANVQDIAGVTTERCWRCGGVVATAR